MLLSPYFLLGWPPLFMTNTLTPHVFCVYLLVSLFSLLCLLFVWVLTSAKGIHCTVQLCRLQSATLQNNASIICLHWRLSFAVLAWGGGGGWCCSRVEPAYQSWIVERVTYSLPLGRTISSPLLYKFFFLNLSLRLSRFLHFFLSTRLSNMLLSKKKWTISTAERSERVENFLFRATREYTEAGIEQAIVAMRRLGANSPEPRKSAVREWHVSTQKTGSYITERSRLPGLIVGPCPSEESLCCPACPPTLPCFRRVSAPSL